MNRLMVILLALAVTLPVVYKSRQSVQESAPAAFFVQSTARTVVRVGGDVRYPGIYRLSANMVTVDAIKLAAPLLPLENMAPFGAGALQPANGADLHVSHYQNGSAVIHSSMIPVTQRMVLGVPLDVNSMNATDFERLPGVGPVLANRIITYRQKNGGISSPEELLMINGIGEKKYNKLKQYFK